MNVACPDCSRVYRLDPARVPDDGATTRCRECGASFRVTGGVQTRPGQVLAGERAEPAVVQAVETAGGEDPRGASAEPSPGGEAPPEATGPGAKARPATPVFGPQDPETRARRLARALVSDIKVYNAERWEQSRSAGTLRKDFRDEILKSWDEYVEQVGEPMAKRTPYFRDALNDILAGGGRVF